MTSPISTAGTIHRCFKGECKQQSTRIRWRYVSWSLSVHLCCAIPPTWASAIAYPTSSRRHKSSAVQWNASSRTRRCVCLAWRPSLQDTRRRLRSAKRCQYVPATTSFARQHLLPPCWIVSGHADDSSIMSYQRGFKIVPEPAGDRIGGAARWGRTGAVTVSEGAGDATAGVGTGGGGAQIFFTFAAAPPPAARQGFEPH